MQKGAPDTPTALAGDQRGSAWSKVWTGVVVPLVHFTLASAVDDFVERERKRETTRRFWLRASVCLGTATILAICFAYYTVNIPRSQASRIWLDDLKVLERQESKFGTDGRTWLCPCSDTSLSFSNYLKLGILYNGPAGSSAGPDTFFDATCPDRRPQEAANVVGTPELSCFCGQYVNHYLSSIEDTHANRTQYDLAITGCMLLMRRLVSSTFTKTSVSFVEAPFTAQQSNAIDARSSMLHFATSYATLLATSPDTWLCTESLALLLIAAYQLMIDNEYTPGPANFWDMAEHRILPPRTNLTYDQVLAFPIVKQGQSSPPVASAMPYVQFSWPDYLQACSPPYCDVVKHVSDAYRAFLAFSAFGGIWTAVFLIVQVLLWPCLEWLLLRGQHSQD